VITRTKTAMASIRHRGRQRERGQYLHKNPFTITEFFLPLLLFLTQMQKNETFERDRDRVLRRNGKHATSWDDIARNSYPEKIGLGFRPLRCPSGALLILAIEGRELIFRLWCWRGF